MKVILFGATGMVGQGVLMECVASPAVEKILTVGRSATGTTDPKVTEVVHPDLYDYTAIQSQLAGYDACFFCLGVSSVGMTEDAYRRITFDLTLAAAKALVAANPGMTFIYVSGASTDSTGKGSSMWARVKGQTENALLEVGFKAAYMFRPGYIQPMKGIRSKTGWYQAMYTTFGALYPLFKGATRFVTSTDRLGQAMIKVAQQGFPRPILESADINSVVGP
jgi:uncharacterized protein YbjT (DUF2867 family)